MRQQTNRKSKRNLERAVMKMMRLTGPTAMVGHAPNARHSKCGRISSQRGPHRTGGLPSCNKDAKTCGKID